MNEFYRVMFVIILLGVGVMTGALTMIFWQERQAFKDRRIIDREFKQEMRQARRNRR